MKKSLFLLLLVGAMLLSACSTVNPPETIPTDATEDPVAVDTTPKETVPVDTTPKETIPADTTPTEPTPEFSGRLLSQEEVVQLEDCLNSSQSYYGSFLGASQFTSLDDPEMVMMLYTVFGTGLRGTEPDTLDELTEQERNLIYGDEPNWRNRYRMTKEEVLPVIMDYLGVDEDHAMELAVSDPGMKYLEETGCFYTMETYNYFPIGIYAAYEQEDGTILICYRDMLKAEMESAPYTHVAVLRPREGGYSILSNVPAQP